MNDLFFPSFQGAAKCWVFERRCRNRECTEHYTGEDDCIYFWSSETAIAVEVLYDFERQLFTRTSFSSFCDHMSHIYKSGSMSDNIKFMSSMTFINCFFGWLSSMKIDFRKSVDPWCNYDPKILACDGTHVGVAVKKIHMEAIEKPDIAQTKHGMHTRYDRVFLPYSANGNDVHEKLVRRARVHLKYLGNKYLKIQNPKKDKLLSSDEEAEENANLLQVCPTESKELLQLFAYSPSEIEPRLLQSLAKLLKNLASDDAMEAHLPFRHLDEILSVFQTLTDIDRLEEISCKEVFEVLTAAADSVHRQTIQHFLQNLVFSIRKTHSVDVQTEEATLNVGSYDPSSGVAYYFTPSGEKVRNIPMYTVNGRKPTNVFDDVPVDPCSKDFPSVGTGGFSSMFLWFCPIHGHSYGFHLIPRAEGRKDPFVSMLKYLPNPPEHVFYDFACSLSEYSLNREPDFFKNVRFWHDIFHSLTHICGDSFKSTRVKGLHPNTEICEQFNAYLQRIKYTATHLSQEKFCFLMQYAIYKWNEKCTNACKIRMKVKEMCAV